MADLATDQQAEIEALRARVRELENELADRTERAHAAVAAAQERVVWLDRWRLDLNAMMERPMAQRTYAAYWQARRALGLARRLRRRMSR